MTAPASGSTGYTARSLDQLVDVETPEQVVFSYTVAGVGSRAAAALIDYLICLGALVALLFGVAALSRVTSFGLRPSGPWIMVIFIAAQFAILWGYYVLFEGLADGQTPGKRKMGLRVVQDGGYSVSFAASAVRNLVRIVDMQPAFTYGIGIVSAAVSASGKRLGDIVAGTMVVRERVVHLAPAAAPAAGGAPAPLSTLLTDEEFGLLERFEARWRTLDQERRRMLADQLWTRFKDRAPEITGQPAGAILRLVERERLARARGVAARSDTGAQREQHAIVAKGAERWSAFARRLDEAQRRGLAKMSEQEISEFVAEYRELTTDLARLRTAARGREVDALFYLSRLVAGGHNLFYRQNALVAVQIWNYVVRDVPREVRRSWRPILLAALFLFGPAAIAHVAVVRHPESAATFIPAGMIDRAERGVERAKQGTGYIDDPQLYRPVMASAIMANNVQVTFAAFAFGITLGVGTILLLVFNGISLGGVMGLYQSKGIAGLLLAFVAPHGTLELTAICIAGGGGLLLGSALVLPGAMTRREALVDRGRRAIRLIACSTMFLIVAGLIEGNISPIPWWPLEWKVWVSAVSGLVMLLYLTRGRAGLRQQHIGMHRDEKDR